MSESAKPSVPVADDALTRLAAELRDDEVIGPYVSKPTASPVLGELVAVGPRATEAPSEYGLLFEAIREGFLMHYGDPRLVSGADADLRLLAGDYLYALGLERLAARGDIVAVHELADLISLSAQVHAGSADGADELIDLLWLASAVAVGAGTDEPHEAAKRSIRGGGADGARLLAAATAANAERSGMSAALARTADSIGFDSKHLFDRG